MNRFEIVYEGMVGLGGRWVIKTPDGGENEVEDWGLVTLRWFDLITILINLLN